MKRQPTKARFNIDIEMKFNVRGANDDGEPGRYAGAEFEREALYHIKEELDAILVRDCIRHSDFEAAIMEGLSVEDCDKFSDIGYCKITVTKDDAPPLSKRQKDIAANILMKEYYSTKGARRTEIGNVIRILCGFPPRPNDNDLKVKRLK